MDEPDKQVGWAGATRGERPKDVDAAAEAAAACVETHADTLVTNGSSNSAVMSLRRWAAHVRRWRIPVPRADVDDLLKGDAVMLGVGERRRPRNDAQRRAIARGTWLREAAGIGDAIEARVKEIGWSPAGVSGVALVPHRIGLLAALDEDLAGELYSRPRADAPPPVYKDLPDGVLGEYPEPEEFPPTPNFRDPSEQQAIDAWDSVRVVTLDRSLLAASDAWDAVATLVHERAHDAQWMRECERYFVGFERAGDVAQFAVNQQSYVPSNMAGYEDQPLEDDAYRREAIALLRWALLRTGHPDHRIPLTGNPYRLMRRVRR